MMIAHQRARGPQGAEVGNDVATLAVDDPVADEVEHRQADRVHRDQGRDDEHDADR